MPSMGPPFTADAPVGVSAPVTKALAAKQAITDLGNMAPPPSRAIIVRDTNGQALAYVYCEDDGTAGNGQAVHPRRGPTHRRQHRQDAGAAAPEVRIAVSVPPVPRMQAP